MSSVLPVSPFLRRVLAADALLSGASGLLMTAGAAFLAPRLGLPAELLGVAGLSLLPFAAALAWLATRRQLPRAALWALVAYNTLWVLDSALLLAGGWFEPTWLGQAFVVLQALVVAVLAELQVVGLRRAQAAAPV
ncbi:hypothetical protein OOT46_15500 [Aquabacterium sp. A7-Y]|uniref:hypothetical protein n=1 Tax=Aquabacterium sp. A7-Y TaxID=1349605 RepID=UPI00223CD6B6|nr:hypothetical protein [Aquabacterium sp. A7-Y]MCW7539249.1 hypothetical protein [Aquabacterium sp. A7-Y]